MSNPPSICSGLLFPYFESYRNTTYYCSVFVNCKSGYDRSTFASVTKMGRSLFYLLHTYFRKWVSMIDKFQHLNNVLVSSFFFSVKKRENRENRAFGLFKSPINQSFQLSIAFVWVVKNGPEFQSARFMILEPLSLSPSASVSSR